jgi:hypothetical protein
MKDKRFVIQEHQRPEGVHWDLMLEETNEVSHVLTTFRLAEPPERVLRHRVGAERIFDHPLRFLWYEGPVQNGTGRVRIVDRGTWRRVQARDCGLAIWDCGFESRRQSAIGLVFDGTMLQGVFTLTRLSETEWRFERRRNAPGA